MSPPTSIVINGVEVYEFNNRYDRWFFRKSDRSIESSGRDEGLSTLKFTGFRTNAATIRRRMAHAGYDTESCQHYFEHHKSKLISFLQTMIGRKADQHIDRLFGNGENRNARSQKRFYERYLNAVMDTSLADWIAAFPEAVAMSNMATIHDSDEPTWFELSETPLVNAMLSNVPVGRHENLTGIFNFPGPDWQQFTVAFLASCTDDAVCELNIERLITEADIKSFQEYNELLRQQTELHIGCRFSVNEIRRLSASQPENTSLQRMCYSSLITAMEAYLGDILRREIFSRSTVKQKFVKSYEPFQKQKFTFSDIYEKLAKMDGEIKDALDGLSLHKIDAAKSIFSNTLNITFPDASVASLGAAVKCRHDIVHRNGKDKDGESINILHADVKDLAREVLKFTREIDKQVLYDIQQEINLEQDDDANSRFFV